MELEESVPGSITISTPEELIGLVGGDKWNVGLSWGGDGCWCDWRQDLLRAGDRFGREGELLYEEDFPGERLNNLTGEPKRALLDDGLSSSLKLVSSRCQSLCLSERSGEDLDFPPAFLFP
jgi:hypothetical protein